MIIIDNYDSFTYNIVEYFKVLGVNLKVYKNNEITIKELKKKNFSSAILSPGPNNPNKAGICLDFIDYFKDKKKILGVCLGHQAIAQYFGAKIVKAKNQFTGRFQKFFLKRMKTFFMALNKAF